MHRIDSASKKILFQVSSPSSEKSQISPFVMGGRWSLWFFNVFLKKVLFIQSTQERRESEREKNLKQTPLNPMTLRFWPEPKPKVSQLTEPPRHSKKTLIFEWSLIKKSSTLKIDESDKRQYPLQLFGRNKCLIFIASETPYVIQGGTGLISRTAMLFLQAVRFIIK